MSSSRRFLVSIPKRRTTTICTRRKPIIRLRTPRRCDRPRLRCPPSDWRRHRASCWSWRARYTRNAGLSNGVETACLRSQGPLPLNSRRGKKNRGDLPGDGRPQSSVVGQIMAGRRDWDPRVQPYPTLSLAGKCHSVDCKSEPKGLRIWMAAVEAIPDQHTSRIVSLVTLAEGRY